MPCITCTFLTAFRILVTAPGHALLSNHDSGIRCHKNSSAKIDEADDAEAAVKLKELMMLKSLIEAETADEAEAADETEAADEAEADDEAEAAWFADVAAATQIVAK